MDEGRGEHPELFGLFAHPAILMLLPELTDFSRRLPARHSSAPLNARVSAGTFSPFPMSEGNWSMYGTQKKITAKRTNTPAPVAAKCAFLWMSSQTPATP